MSHRIITSVSCTVLLCVSVLTLGASPAQVQQLSKVDPEARKQAMEDYHGEDLKRKDGSLTPIELNSTQLRHESGPFRKAEGRAKATRAFESGALAVLDPHRTSPVHRDHVVIDATARPDTGTELRAALKDLSSENVAWSGRLLSATIPVDQLSDAEKFSCQLRPSGDYVWMNYYRLREGRSWVRVLRSGHTLHVKFKGKDTVSSVKVDTLSPSRTTGLFDHLRRVQFFELNDASTPDSVQVEADILTVEAQAEGKRHQVSARPPVASPPGLMSLADSLESIASTLNPVEEGTLVKGLSLSKSRAEELRKSGAPQLAFAEASEYGTIQSAVKWPDQFFLLREASGLREKIADAPYFLVSRDEGSVAIEFYPIKNTGQ